MSLHIFNQACRVVETFMPEFEPVLRVARPVRFLDQGAAALPTNSAAYGEFLGSQFALPEPVVAIFAQSELTVLADRRVSQCGAQKARCFFLFSTPPDEKYGPEAVEFVFGQIDEAICFPTEFSDSAFQHWSARPHIQRFAVFGPKGFYVKPIIAPNKQLENSGLLAAALKSVINSMRLVAFVSATGGSYTCIIPVSNFNPNAGKKIPRIPQRPVFEPRPYANQ